MSWTYTEEYYKTYTRDTWNECAAEYARWADVLAPFGADLLARLQARRGEDILDIATGPGEPALTLAGQVGPDGCVAGIDLAENMIVIARETARARGIKNVSFQTMDAEDLRFEDGSFDAVVSRFGFQIFTDPDRVAREAHRVLRPGGRIALTVWSTADRVPAIHAIIGPMLEHAEPDENGYIPTPYELGGDGEMIAFLQKAGFRDVREDRVTHTAPFKDEEDYLSVVMKASPIGHSLREETPEVQREVLRKTRENLQRWKTPGGLRIPGEAVVVTARK